MTRVEATWLSAKYNMLMEVKTNMSAGFRGKVSFFFEAYKKYNRKGYFIVEVERRHVSD